MDIGARGAAAEAVAAAGIAVDGGLECTGLKAHGTVSIQVAKITGSVDLSGAEIASPGGRALGADYAEIGGRLDCSGMVVAGQTTLHNSRVAASVTFSGSKLENPAGWALSAGGVTVDGGVFFDRGFSAQGEVRLVGARLAANLTLSGATFRNPGAVAVNLDRAVVGVCHGDHLTCAGRFSFVGARIASGLELQRAQVDAGAGNLALAGDGSAMEGSLALTGIRTRGEVSLRSARIGRAVLMMGAVLENKEEIALRMSGADVAGDVVCAEISVTGAMRLTGARVGGGLSLDQARLTNPGRTALSARSLVVGQLSLRPGHPVEGSVDLSHARIEVLRDDPRCWPSELSLDGLTYQALEPPAPGHGPPALAGPRPSGPSVAAVRAPRRPLPRPRAARRGPRGAACAGTHRAPQRDAGGPGLGCRAGLHPRVRLPALASAGLAGAAAGGRHHHLPPVSAAALAARRRAAFQPLCLYP